MKFKSRSQTLVYLKYLENDLIPVTSFSPEEIEAFKQSLESLSYHEKRKINRKFRKIFKKIVRKSNVNYYSTHLISLYGLDSSKPNKNQLRASYLFRFCWST